MTFEIIIEDAALEEIQEAYNYYEKQQEGLGERFKNELSRCVKKIRSNPQHYSKIDKEIRQALVDKFPFLVVYEVIDSGLILIYAVFHKNRNPTSKLKRR